MRAKFIICLFLIISASGMAQRFAALQFDSLYTFPGQKKTEASDLSASLSFEVSADSFFISINVTDDQLVETAQGDRIEIWFALPETQYSDYILGTKGSHTRIFRNSPEFGDNASLDALLKNSDYPEGLVDLDGKKITPDCPARSALREERMFFGITHFVFPLNAASGIQVDRDKYDALRDQLGDLPDELSGLSKHAVTRNSSGYSMRISFPVAALGFARFQAKEFRFCADVFDVDPSETEQAAISSTPNRFYARPHYFNLIKLPFALNIGLPGIDPNIVAKSGLSLHVYRAGNKWVPVGFGTGPLIYCEGLVSETGLVEFLTYPITVRYDIIQNIPGKEIGHLVLNYRDLSPFRQEDHYFLVDGEVVVSKGYSCSRERKGDFVNQPFSLPDGEIAFVLYDFEPADPLGWGEYGKMADEFVYIQQIGKNNRQLFSGGQRLEVLRTAAFGETPDLLCEQVSDVEYTWKEKGKAFEIRVKGMQKAYDRRFVFERDMTGVFKVKN
jgi:hypothetical protein